MSAAMIDRIGRRKRSASSLFLRERERWRQGLSSETTYIISRLGVLSGIGERRRGAATFLYVYIYNIYTYIHTSSLIHSCCALAATTTPANMHTHSKTKSRSFLRRSTSRLSTWQCKRYSFFFFSCYDDVCFFKKMCMRTSVCARVLARVLQARERERDVWRAKFR